MHAFQKKSFVWATLCVWLFLEITVVESGSHPVFVNQGRDTRDADFWRYHRTRNYSKGRGSSRFNAAQV